MSTFSIRVLPLCLLAALSVVTFGAQSQDNQGRERGRRGGHGQDDEGSLANMVRNNSRRGETPLGVDQVPYDGGRTINRIKFIDPQGRVRTLMDDAQSRGQRDDSRPTRRDDNDND